jgi:predicted RNase H-like nuclease (RuvC/YqgF family)
MSSISEITRQVQEAGLYDKQQCPHCGLPFNKRQNDIDCYRCGSSYSDTLKPNWARSMTCLQIENGQLRERMNIKLRERINIMDDEALLSSDVFETDRSIKWDLSQQIEKLKRELHAANERIKRLESFISEVAKPWECTCRFTVWDLYNKKIAECDCCRAERLLKEAKP